MGKLNAINQLVNHRQFSFRKLYQYSQHPNQAPQNLQDGRWRQFGLLPGLRTIFRCNGLHIGYCLHLLWCCIRNCEVWRWYLCHGCPSTRLDCQNIVPVIMAGIIGIYGLVVSVLISDGLKQQLPLYTGFIQLGAGLSVGLAGLAAGFAIGIVGDAGVRGTAQQPRLFVGMILILIFAEVLGLYGLIVALLMN